MEMFQSNITTWLVIITIKVLEGYANFGLIYSLPHMNYFG